MSARRWLAPWLLALAALLLPLAAGAQPGGGAFDHQTTGFSLTGKHEDVRCETCHIKGIFKGTPKDCASCHVQGNQRGALAKSAKHIPTTRACDACHGTSSFNAVLFSHANVDPGRCASCHNNVTSRGKPADHVPTTASCDACHSTVGFAPVLKFDHQASSFGSWTCTSCHDGRFAKGKPANHIPTQAASRCESCHQSAIAGGFQSWAGGMMDHTGYASGCAQCHASGVANSFYGVRIMSPASLTPPHLPTGDNCETCHQAIPAQLIPATGAASVGATTFAGGRMVHAGITSGCATCHGPSITSASFYGVTPKTNAGLVPPHIPAGTNCEACHSNAIPAMPIPAAGAGSVGGTTFANGQMSHAGITSGCAACHGPGIGASSFFGISAIVVMPPTTPAGPNAHIPSSTACENCHLGSTPAGLLPANATRSAPGSAFATPVPTSGQIHAGVTGGCNACHDTGASWMGMSNYPISPSTFVMGGRYTGFHTRPTASASTFSVADPAHPASGDCSQCHSSTSYFDGAVKPANHIPTAATAQCTACHTTGDFSTLPTLANIHANAPSTTSNCAQCHGAAAPSFAIPARGFSVVGLPSNHIPTNASCEACHVGAGSSVPTLPVPNGARFSGSAMSHAGITSNCAACHGPGITASTFAGITGIVAMPPTSPMGPGSHIPSSSTCESCHLGSLANVSGLIPASTTRTAPGTLFATPLPTSAQIHAGVTSGCAGCHEANYAWMGMSAYPISPTVKTAGALYRGFQTRPNAAGGTFAIADAAHPNAGDCSQCHSSTTAFSAIDKPANHIPTATSAECSACHTSSDYSVMPSITNIHANAPSTTNNCAQCHGAAAPSFAIPAANFSIVGLPSNHIPTTVSCEACHVGAGSSITALPVVDGAKFSGSRMSHAGITNNCAACHLPSGSTTTFAGITRIVGMPPTSPMGANAHIPSSTTCESCHLGTLANVSGLIPASATRTAPGTLFATPAPTGAQIHAGVTSGCAACHEANYVWMGVSVYPISPTVKTAGAQYKGFQTRPRAAAGTYNVADASHPSTGDCSQCHSGTTAFTAIDKPANHIPTAASAQCTACHTSTDYSVMPTLAAIHANAPSTTTNCAQCHGSAAPSFAIPAANFSIVGLPSNHIPTSASCEVCHVGAGSSVPTLPVPNGAKFSGSRMSHAGITNNCAACHGSNITGTSFAGITRIIVMPPTSPMGASAHIPSSSTCESCHLGTLANVSGLIPANATRSTPASLFATPAPTGPQIHAGITSGCSGCHEAGYVWMGVNAYPISPTVKTAGAQYKGFQTRPRAAAGTYNVADATHPSAGDCSQCHSGTTAFTAQDKPANHIPTSASAQCSACHTSSDYSVMPTLANIHANAPSTTTNCAQCHGAAAPSFAIPSANFSIVGLPSNHIPTSASCEACHVGTGSSVPTLPVPNGAKFSGSRMSHAGITNNCAACHGPTIGSGTFAGITRIVVMPPTSPMGAGAHIPSSTTCESCHLGTLANVSGLIPANATRTAPGTLFATPAPTGPQIHTGITSGCNACHEAGYVWMGMASYPISPTVLTAGAQYRGFQTRPRAAAGTYNVANASHPASGDCSQCHTGTTFFSSQGKPDGHIPTTIASCSTCHVVAGDYSVAGLTTSMATLHTGISSGCASCHTAGAGAGPFAGCTTQATCASPPPITYQPKTMPLAAGGSPTAPSSQTHVPVGSTPCESCHSRTVFTSFAGMNMKNNATAHNAVSTATCMSCHEGTPKYTWYGVSITTKGVGHEGRKAGQDCVPCHQRSFNKFITLARVKPVLRSAITMSSPRMMPEFPGSTAEGGVEVSARFNHQGVLPGQCQSCHNGQLAKGLPVKHVMTRLSCDTCHRNTAWTPAQFNHQGTLAGQCQSCHNGSGAAGKPSGHFFTTRSCDSCHRTVAWVPVTYTHLAPGYQPQVDKPTCVSCHITNGEIIPRQLRGGPRPKPIPVTPGS